MSQRTSLTDEHRAKLSAALTGRIKSPEHLLKIANALRGRKRPDCSKALQGRRHADTGRAYVGILYYRKTDQWDATIRFNTQRIWIGRFQTAEAAARAYDAKARALYGPTARTNFPEDTV